MIKIMEFPVSDQKAQNAKIRSDIGVPICWQAASAIGNCVLWTLALQDLEFESKKSKTPSSKAAARVSEIEHASKSSMVCVGSEWLALKVYEQDLNGLNNCE